MLQAVSTENPKVVVSGDHERGPEAKLVWDLWTVKSHESISAWSLAGSAATRTLWHRSPPQEPLLEVSSSKETQQWGRKGHPRQSLMWHVKFIELCLLHFRRRSQGRCYEDHPLTFTSLGRIPSLALNQSLVLTWNIVLTSLAFWFPCLQSIRSSKLKWNVTTAQFIHE